MNEPRKYHHKLWVRAGDVMEITTYTYTHIMRLVKQGILHRKRLLENGNYLYWYADVKKLMGWE